MSNAKEFQGKSLDDAIRSACEYYGVEREKLEIDIVSDAKSGIFGLMGMKKAVIRASRANLDLSVASLMREDENADSVPQDGVRPGDSAQPAARTVSGKAPRGKSAPENAVPEKSPKAAATRQRGENAPKLPPAQAAGEEAPEAREAAPRPSRKPAPEVSGAENRRGGRKDDRSRGDAGRRPRGEEPGGPSSRGEHKQPSARDGNAAERKEGRAPRREPAHSHASRSPHVSPSEDAALDSLRDEFPEFVLDGCDEERLFSVVRDVVQRLVRPIVGDVPCAVEIAGSRVRATVDCGEASGLLVGREGQTLASVQYLASRIVAKELGGSLRLQIDAGNYRERQGDRLRELALALAEKVKQTGRPQSTRPLSAYQRRLVHLALENDETVHTHSKGEGAQRRVIVQLKKDGEE